MLKKLIEKFTALSKEYARCMYCGLVFESTNVYGCPNCDCISWDDADEQDFEKQEEDY